MPFYEYQCKSCGHELEAMQKVSDTPLKKCPHCGKSQLQRLMSAPVFRLKGKGWYETDFKGEGDNKRNLADKPDTDDVKASDTKERDSKSEPKVDSKTDSTAADTPAVNEKADKPASAAAPAKTPSKKVDLKSAKKSAKKSSPKPKRKSR